MYRLRIYVVPLLFMMTLAHYGTLILLYPLLWTSYAAFITITFFRPSEEEFDELVFTEQVVGEDRCAQSDDVKRY